ncbi:sulfotransferase family 2 domain-containing protein [Roseibium album]|uniref:Sulfotransferase family protein n=1 Tax=Roseibium album TaxID=311410 RepID=A0A0M7A6L3_9HYPH|nr:sulfotransferase family 2 domain-containing protein [Roseibium album]CTQ63107.1 Sulfotransferase family protein [Roseibium album]CTQ69274.1 Sulfotransferase family protein [Roseibium album]CTQ80611.1 Sulfotransferase family protein [Roseibium album]
MDEYQLKNFLKFAPSRLGLVPKKRLLVHIPKNGGIAIREALALKNKIVIAHRRRLISKKYANDLLAFKNSNGLHPGYEHARLRDIDHSVRAGTIPFAIVRNPWARTFSRYKFHLQTGGGDLPQRALSIEGFEEFLDTRHEFGKREYYWHRASLGWYPQSDYIIDESGVCSVDILRQENLSEEVSRYFSVSERLENRNVSRNVGVSYKEFYTESSIQLIADWYASDIEMFRFDFDTPAQCGTVFTESA